MKPSLFCFGYGYTASELAGQQSGWTLAGTTRSETLGLKREGATLHQFDGVRPVTDFAEVAKDVTHVLLSVPPSEQGDPVYQVMGEAIASLPNLKWVGYLSTTGVYGDLNGGTATEETACHPVSARGHRRVNAEKQWMTLFREKSLPLHIFRLPGIYGLGRNQIVSVKGGKAHRIVKEGHVFSRIHVADLAEILIASMKTPNPGQIYNVADDLAAPPQDVVTYAAELLGVEPPPFQDFEIAEISPMARSFYSDNKTVSNRKIKEELGICLRFPTYKEGLKALSAEERLCK